MDKLLSICMIVKNEEKVLDRCLSSISKLADEIIIIDTGSIDRTKEIASQYTEHVYDFQWCNDFSAARNESLRHATSKWILVLDADEYINPNDIDKFRNFLVNTPISPQLVYVISIISYVGKSIHTANITESTMVRLFPNRHGIRYFRPIHEQVGDRNNNVLPYTISPITVYHTGYLEETIQRKNKQERNQDIFTELKKKSGFTPYDYYTIGNEYAMKEDLKKALYNYERAYKKATPLTPWRLDCAYNLFTIYMKLDRVFDAWELLQNTFSEHPEYPEYHAFKGSLYEYVGHYELAKQSLLEAYRTAEALSQKTNRFFLLNPSFGSVVPLTRLLQIAKIQQNKDDIIYYSIKLLQANPHDYQTLSILVNVLLTNESNSSVINVLNSVIPDIKIRDYLLLHKLFILHGEKELAAIFNEKIEDKKLIPIDDQLYSAIINDNHAQFEALANKLAVETNSVTIQVIQALMVGSLLWQKSYIGHISTDEDQNVILEHILIYKKIITNDFSDDDIALHIITIHKLLTCLFQLKQYDLFDDYIEKLSHPLVTNLMANYFYHSFNTDLAVSYYNLLLEQNTIDYNGYINLTYLHINSGYAGESIDFLKEAIKINPTIDKLYMILLLNCTDEETANHYRQQFANQSSQYVKLPFIKAILLS